MTRTPLIIAHRGDSDHAPENTMAAFHRALDKHSDGVEFDVQLSSDGVPVVIHDHTLERTGGIRKRVDEMTAEELGRTDVGSWFNKKFKEKSDEKFKKETVPSLAQVLSLLRNSDGLIYIELKPAETNQAALAKAVCEVIRDSPMLPRMIVKSFRLGTLPVVRSLIPEVETAALFAPMILTVLRRRHHIIDMAREFSATQISLHHTLATKKLTTLAAEAGMPVTIWTTESPQWIEKCRKRAIRALITNDPGKMINNAG